MPQSQSNNTFSEFVLLSLTLFILLYKRFWKTWAKTMAIPAIIIRIESTPVLYTQQDFILIETCVFTNRGSPKSFCLRCCLVSTSCYHGINLTTHAQHLHAFALRASIAHDNGHVDKVKTITKSHRMSVAER